MTTKKISIMYATRKDVNDIIKRYGNDTILAAMDGYDVESAKKFLVYMDKHGVNDVYYTENEHGNLMIIPYDLGISITTEIMPLKENKRYDCFYKSAIKAKK